jgi:hypothetical protein
VILPIYKVVSGVPDPKKKVVSGVATEKRWNKTGM